MSLHVAPALARALSQVNEQTSSASRGSCFRQHVGHDAGSSVRVSDPDPPQLLGVHYEDSLNVRLDPASSRHAAAADASIPTANRSIEVEVWVPPLIVFRAVHAVLATYGRPKVSFLAREDAHDACVVDPSRASVRQG